MAEIQDEDEVICHATQKGLESGYANPAILSDWDITSFDFAKWMADQMHKHVFEKEKQTEQIKVVVDA